MKNKKGLKCFVCDMETAIKIFDYKGYIEYFRKRKKMKNKRKISKAIDRINKISGLNYNYPVANMILHDFLGDTIESADAIVKHKDEIMAETPALVYGDCPPVAQIENALRLLVEKNILSKSAWDDWYALNEKYFNDNNLNSLFVKSRH